MNRSLTQAGDIDEPQLSQVDHHQLRLILEDPVKGELELGRRSEVELSDEFDDGRIARPTH